MKRSELILGALLIPIDLAMLYASFYFAYTLRASTALFPLTEPIGSYLAVINFLLPFWFIIFALSGLYAFRRADKFAVQLGRIALATSACAMLAVIFGYLTPNPYITLPLPHNIFPSKFIPIYGLLFSIPLVTAGRLGMNLIRRFLFKFDLGVHRILIVGGTKEAEFIGERLVPSRGFKLIGVIDDSMKEGEKIDGTRVIGGLDLLDNAKRLGHIDDILIADTRLSESTMVKIIEFAEANHISMRFIPSTFGLYAATSVMSNLAGIPVIEVLRTSLDGWGRIVKRAFDSLVSLAALIVLSPIFLVIAALIKFTMPGPIFFRHKRLGRHGKTFEVIKFRSMVMDAEDRLAEILEKDPAAKKEWESTYKLKNDPRVTGLGRFIRKYSIDELPQLFNVLIGDMSLVGPRPIVPGEQERYGELKHALLVLKPGLTGLWQVMGRNDISYKKRVELDAYYIERWSLLLDVIILFKTFKAVIGKATGY